MIKYQAHLNVCNLPQYANLKVGDWVRVKTGDIKANGTLVKKLGQNRFQVELKLNPEKHQNIIRILDSREGEIRK